MSEEIAEPPKRFVADDERWQRRRRGSNGERFRICGNEDEEIIEQRFKITGNTNHGGFLAWACNCDKSQFLRKEAAFTYISFQ